MTGAYHLADIAHITGLVAAGVHSLPIEHADFVTGSTHKTIHAGRGGIIMCEEEDADDVDSAVFPGGQDSPLMHNVADTAAGFDEALDPAFATYVANAKTLATVLQENGLSLVSGGTDKHLLLVDLRERHPDLTGKDAEAVDVIVNKNTVPREPRSPFVTSGIRIGTPCVTTRGFEEEEMRTVGEGIMRVLDAPEDEDARADVADEVRHLCEEHPVYG